MAICFVVRDGHTLYVNGTPVATFNRSKCGTPTLKVTSSMAINGIYVKFSNGLTYNLTEGKTAHMGIKDLLVVPSYKSDFLITKMNSGDDRAVSFRLACKSKSGKVQFALNRGKNNV